MSIGTRIKEARRDKKLTQKQLADKVGIKQPSLSELENGDSAGTTLTASFAAALGVSALWLETGIGNKFSEKVIETNIQQAPLGSRKIPLIRYVQAGCMAEVVDPYQVGDGSEYLLTDQDLGVNAFALQIKGDSMLPEFREGDRIIIDPSLSPLPGDFVVAKNGHEEATFKKYRPRGINERGNDVFELVPLNDDFAPMRSDVTPLRIIGVMVEHRKYRRR